MIDRLPEPLSKQLGTPEQALTFELDAGRRLGTEDPEEVRKNLTDRGYHVQMPRSVESILADIAKQQAGKK